MDDLIRRQLAIDALRNYLVGKNISCDGTMMARLIENEVINKLPSAQPTFDARDTQYNLPIGTDLISRAQAIEVVQNRHMMLSKEKVLLINDLEKLPSAQPIIRCKDCAWWTKQEDSLQGRCALLQIYPTGEWFCGNAGRREETA